jgi:hypothetical protein
MTQAVQMNQPCQSLENVNCGLLDGFQSLGEELLIVLTSQD